MYIKYTMYIKVYTIEPYLKTNNTSSKKKKPHIIRTLIYFYPTNII